MKKEKKWKRDVFKGLIEHHKYSKLGILGLNLNDKLLNRV